MLAVTYKVSNGLVTGLSSGVPDISTLYLDAGQAALEVSEYIDIETSRVVNNQIVSIPKKPDYFYEWDNALEAWIDTRGISLLVQEKNLKINEERERRNHLPIDYDGNLFDADAEAQRNVSAWMTNVAAGQNPPTGFEWRGYDNTNHPADAAFVVGLGNAITLRGTYLYQRSWIKKAEVDALTTAEAVKAYDVTTGW